MHEFDDKQWRINLARLSVKGTFFVIGVIGTAKKRYRSPEARDFTHNSTKGQKGYGRNEKVNLVL